EGVRIFYEITGEGAPVVFVHGLGGTSNVWSAQRAALSKSFRVVAFDLPGSGRSEKAGGPYSMEGWVELLRGLHDQAAAGKFVLVGNSMTTVLAQKFAAKYGDRLAGLVLCGPITELAPAGKEAFGKRAEDVQREGMLAVADKVVAGALTAATREANPALTGM